jgi:hypothetical protein
MLHSVEHYPHPAIDWPSDELGDWPCIQPGCTIRDSELGSWTELMAGTRMVESVFSDYSYTAGDVNIIYSDVGRFCSIASHVRINPGNHPMGRVTQHHCTYRRRRFGFSETDDEAFFEWRRTHRVRIGHDVWIGHGAIVMPGVSIGTGAVVGSAAVVTRDVPAYAVAVGVPAKVIRYRFDEATIGALQRIAWWDWDRATLEARFEDMLNIEAFVEEYDVAVPEEGAALT